MENASKITETNSSLLYFLFFSFACVTISSFLFFFFKKNLKSYFGGHPTSVGRVEAGHAAIPLSVLS